MDVRDDDEANGVTVRGLMGISLIFPDDAPDQVDGGAVNTGAMRGLKEESAGPRVWVVDGNELEDCALRCFLRLNGNAMGIPNPLFGLIQCYQDVQQRKGLLRDVVLMHFGYSLALSLWIYFIHYY